MTEKTDVLADVCYCIDHSPNDPRHHEPFDRLEALGLEMGPDDGYATDPQRLLTAILEQCRCENCEGRGMTDMADSHDLHSQFITCPDCHGAGYVYTKGDDDE